MQNMVEGSRKDFLLCVCSVCLGYGQCSEILQNLRREGLQSDSRDIRTWLSSIFDGKILTSMFLMIVFFFFALECDGSSYSHNNQTYCP